jgi:SAM-dependent methyltransferase
MKGSKRYENQKSFWEEAGKTGYGKAMFSNKFVEEHIMQRHWQAALDTAYQLGLNKDSKVLELGCGDGKFSESMLSGNFKKIDAFDMSESAINNARLNSKSANVSFFVRDATEFQCSGNDYWDGAFMMGFLHHVKEFAPVVVNRLSKVCPKIILVDPNGDNWIRKLLELLPGYRRAGENSFSLKELEHIFGANGYKLKKLQKMTVVPPFVPGFLFAPFKNIEEFVESNRFLSKLCCTYIIGFERDGPA